MIAKEPPTKKTAAFSTNLPTCRRGFNKTCRVEELILAERETIDLRLEQLSERSEQLTRAISVFRSVLDKPSTELSVDDCRRAGDCLIALEGMGSRNAFAFDQCARVGADLSGVGMGVRSHRVPR